MRSEPGNHRKKRSVVIWKRLGSERAETKTIQSLLFSAENEAIRTILYPLVDLERDPISLHGFSLLHAFDMISSEQS